MERSSRLLMIVALACGLEQAAGEPVIMTVTGPVRAAELGPVLPHEHVMSIFGMPAAAVPAYDVAALRAAVVPALRTLREDGVATLFDCTAEYFGRDPALLRELSHESGLRLVTNTGYYGASGGRYLPPDITKIDADAIAARWIAEARHGIGNTGVRPGFIKLGIDGGPLDDVARKLIRAAARTHLATGLTLAVHTGANTDAAAEQLELLRAEGVSPDAWIWVHAHQAGEIKKLIAAARAGAWLSLDGWNKTNAPLLLEQVKKLKAAGLLHHVLLSHDGNLYPALGWKPRPMRFLFTEGRARMDEAGIAEADWKQMTTVNPAEAFSMRIRPLSDRDSTVN